MSDTKQSKTKQVGRPETLRETAVEASDGSAGAEGSRTEATGSGPMASGPETQLARWVDEIKTAHEQVNINDGLAMRHGKECLKHALRAGDLLNRTKSALGHGMFTAWIGEKLPEISATTIRRYMRLAKQPHVAEASVASSLRQAYIAAGIINAGKTGKKRGAGKGEDAPSPSPEGSDSSEEGDVRTLIRDLKTKLETILDADAVHEACIELATCLEWLRNREAELAEEVAEKATEELVNQEAEDATKEVCVDIAG